MAGVYKEGLTRRGYRELVISRAAESREDVSETR